MQHRRPPYCMVLAIPSQINFGNVFNVRCTIFLQHENIILYSINNNIVCFSIVLDINTYIYHDHIIYFHKFPSIFWLYKRFTITIWLTIILYIHKFIFLYNLHNNKIYVQNTREIFSGNTLTGTGIRGCSNSRNQKRIIDV